MKPASSLRRRLRVPLPVELLRSADGAPRFLGYLEDISDEGMFVQCATPRAVGTRFVLRFRLPDEVGVLDRVDAEVEWTRGYAGRNGPAPGMRLRFLGPFDERWAEVRAFCAGQDPRTCAEIGHPDEKPSGSQVSEICERARQRSIPPS